MKTVGFLATRFVESETANEAIKEAIHVVENEAMVAAARTKDSIIELSEICEDVEGYER